MARSDPRIPYSELRDRALTVGLTDDEIERYFEVDQKAAERLKFSVKLNSTTVRQDGGRVSRDEVNDLLRQVDNIRLAAKPDLDLSIATKTGVEKSLTTAKNIGPPSKPRILNEGDSWFNLPPVLKPLDAMDFLQKWFNIVPLAWWGATLDQIVKDKQYMTNLEAGTGYDMFMFSAGGNDVLASIEKCVDKRKPGDNDPANAASYVNDEFRKNLNRVMSKYQEMVDDVRSVIAPSNLTIFVHGYANAIPVKGGKYLGKHLKKKGFDPVQQAGLCRAIVAHMVGRFNARLAQLKLDNPGLVYVDLRSTMADSYWNWDEIHPNRDGALEIAKKFRQEINAVLASS
jgi:lysophospholipase L1-like esterase